MDKNFAVSKTDFAMAVGRSRPIIYEAIRVGRLDTNASGDVLLYGQTTTAFLEERGTNPDNIRPLVEKRMSRKGSKKAKGKIGVQKQPEPLPEPPKPVLDPVASLDAPSGMEDLFSDDSVSGLNRLLAREKILTLRQKREYEAGTLIARTTVQKFVNGLYAIHSNELRAIAIRCSPAVMAECALTDPAMALKIESVVDAEISSTMLHIQRKLKDFLKQIKAEEELAGD